MNMLYDVISSADIKDLMKQVEDKINSRHSYTGQIGWEPRGGLAVKGEIFYQVMILKPKVKK